MCGRRSSGPGISTHDDVMGKTIRILRAISVLSFSGRTGKEGECQMTGVDLALKEGRKVRQKVYLHFFVHHLCVAFLLMGSVV